MFKERIIKKKYSYYWWGISHWHVKNKNVSPALCSALGVSGSGLQRSQVMGPVMWPSHEVNEKPTLVSYQKSVTWLGFICDIMFSLYTIISDLSMYSRLEHLQ